MNSLAFVAYLLTATINIPGQPQNGVSLPYATLADCQAGGRLLEATVEGNYVGSSRPTVRWTCKPMN